MIGTKISAKVFHALKHLRVHGFRGSVLQRKNTRSYKYVISAFSGSVISFLGGLTYIVVYSKSENEPKKKIVVLGSGWGAVNFIRSLKPDEYDVAIVSPQNYFLFTPLLPGVTVGTVEGRSIVEPIRKIITRKHKSGVKFYEAECTEVKVQDNKVVCTDLSDIVGKQQEFTLGYDYLVVAVGAQTATFNIKGVAENTHYLKNVKQAQEIRKNIMDSFETANMPGQPDHEIRRLLHFVVVGGGPTGVEFAAELRDFLKSDLTRFYPKELIEKSQITLVDGLNKILNTYSEEISRYTESHFKREGINVITNTFVTGVESNLMHLMDSKTKEVKSMGYGMCVWSAGNAPRSITKKIMKEVPGQTNRMGLITDTFLKVKNTENVFAVGDCATIQYEKLVNYIDDLFNEIDVKKTGELDFDQFEDVLESGMKKCPHLCHQFKEIEDLFDQADRNKSKKISRDEFRTFALEVDAVQTALPPTAQVATQEGKYLGKLLSDHEMEISMNFMDHVVPFRYDHLGSFAYVGKNRAVLELPLVGAFKGWSTMWLWRGAYASEAVSLRMRVLILFDWIKSYVFGRDISRI